MHNRVDHLAAAVIGLYFIAAILLATSGCQSTRNKSSAWKDRFNLAKDIPWPTSREQRENPPERLASFWTDAVQTRPGGKPMRGFGGRIYLYDHRGGEPVQADGQLVVYAFDEAGRSQSDNRPTKRYVFPPEQFAKHASESELGPSYSVWLPWDDAGGEQKKISLIARFEPNVGSTIVGRQSMQQLPGSPVVETVPVADGPQLASYSQGTGERERFAGSATPSGTVDRGEETVDRKQRMTTTSIALPPRVGQGMPQASVRKEQLLAGRDKTTSYRRGAASQRRGAVDAETVATTGTMTTGATLHLAPATQAGTEGQADNQVNSTTLQPRLSGFRLEKRLAPEGRVSPPRAFRRPY